MSGGGNAVKYTKSRSSIIIRCVSLVLVACLFLFAAMGVRAADAEDASALSTDVVASLTARNNRLVEYLKENAAQGDIRPLIDGYIGGGRFGLDSSAQNQLGKILQNRNTVITLNSVDLGNGYSLTFLSNGTLSLDELKERQISPTDPSITGLVSNPSSIQGQTQYKWASNDRYEYSPLGIFLFHIHIESYFGYDGVNASYGGGLSGYYEKGGLPNPWQVSNWEVGTTIVEGGSYCRAFARGNFHWGIEYQGVGIVLQDVYEDVRVSVTRDGTVYKN